jgi:diaminopimelate epimerase
MDFVKMEGLGNDFMVVAGPVEVTAEDVTAWCDRRRGIGADGVLEVTPLDGNRVRMRYWNADGSPAEMCGNGLRCVARYAAVNGLVEGDEFTVDTPVGPRPAQLRGGARVRVLLGRPRTESGGLDLDGVTVFPVTMGNPHAVMFVEDPGTAPVGTLGPHLETAAAFPGGTNVEFARVTGAGAIELRVWERGVGETLACGTGAAATAFLAHQQGRVGESVAVRLPGGELLVELDAAGAWIEGPANFVFSGSIG